MARICELTDDQLHAAIDLLTEGFTRKRRYWENAIERLRSHPTPSGMPRFGYGIVHDKALVGVLLTISTRMGDNSVRCNLSSWYVRPAFRHLAPILAQQPLKNKEVTIFNLSPAIHTWPILEAQGFSRFSNGRFVSIPLFGRNSKAKAHPFPNNLHLTAALNEYEMIILADHYSYGCFTIIIETADGTVLPFVFGRQPRYGFLLTAHLVYCRDLASFIEHAHVIGRFLSRYGYFFVLIDAWRPVKGLVGRFWKDRPRYRRGTDNQIYQGDVAYSELEVFSTSSTWFKIRKFRP
jgi:hypothetical protein